MKIWEKLLPKHSKKPPINIDDIDPDWFFDNTIDINKYNEFNTKQSYNRRKYNRYFKRNK